MMSKRQWIALFTLYTLYVLLGAALFFHLEKDLETERRQEVKKQRSEIEEMLIKCFEAGTSTPYVDAVKRLSAYCDRPFFSTSNDSNTEYDMEPLRWDFYNSVFFVITVVSTIGYGNLAPSSATGRLLMIVYALIGIPMNGIMLASLGEFFSTALLRVHRRYKRRRSETRAGLIADIILYLIPGFVIFIFLPTGVFMHFEGWTFDESLYYAFVTLTTIGFGDFVAGQTDKLHDNEIMFILYKILLLVWIVFGLGYLVMILGFITRAMRSKKMARLEHKLAANIKHTQSKLWSSFTRDVSYFRRILNELYVMKLKPVYKDEEPTRYKNRTRSSSEPMLYALPAKNMETSPGFGVWRRRANSETAAGVRMPRVLSESDLGRIDRDATFRIAAFIEPGELLVHMVNALSNDDKGIQGFSDSEILASEEGTNWSIGGEKIPKRGRAASDVHIPMKEQLGNAEWTWSGDQPSRHIHGLMRARHKSLTPFSNSSRRPSLFQIAAAKLKQPLKKTHKAKSIGDISSNNRPQESNYFTHTGMHPALEETSIADFLRAMSSIQTRTATDSTPGPRRKDGVSSFVQSRPLHTLFTPPERRLSLRPSPSTSLRSGSLHSSSLHPEHRRFSVHPATNSLPLSNNSPVQPLRRMAPHLFSGKAGEHTQRTRSGSTSDRT